MAKTEPVLESLVELHEKFGRLMGKTESIENLQKIANGRTSKVEGLAEANKLDIALFQKDLQSVITLVKAITDDKMEVQKGFRALRFNLLQYIITGLMAGIIAGGVSLTGYYFTDRRNAETDQNLQALNSLLRDPPKTTITYGDE